MKAVLLPWCACLLALVLSLVHFAWVAQAAERILTPPGLVRAGVVGLRGRK